MIVVGVDPHKQTHTACAVSSPIGELTGELTVKARAEGHAQLLAWARALGPERVFALEDVRRCSGGLERFLLGRGEHVLRVPPKLIGASRKGQRQRGKSDSIDALAVAHAALRQPDLPQATLAGRSLEIRLLLDYRDDLIAERTRLGNRLRWLVHDLGPALEPPAKGLRRRCWTERLRRQLARREQSAQVRIARRQLARIMQLNPEIAALERELEELVALEAPRLLTLHGCGTLSAARIVAEVAGVGRFQSAAKLAMHAGTAPIPASSGQISRHRLNRFGNRGLNSALHQVALTQARWSPQGKAYLARKKAEGKTPKEALRCLKRQLARRVFALLQADAAALAAADPTGAICDQALT